MKTRLLEGLQKCQQSYWSKVCGHVKKVEDQFRQQDGLLYKDPVDGIPEESDENYDDNNDDNIMDRFVDCSDKEND